MAHIRHRFALVGFASVVAASLWSCGDDTASPARRGSAGSSSGDANAGATAAAEAGQSAASARAGEGSASSGAPNGGNANLEAGAGAGQQGGQGNVAPPGNCNGDVSDDPECWTTNEHGVFVSSEYGDDASGDGTLESPYASIGKGIAAAGDKRIYVCAGIVSDSYDERIGIDSTNDGLRIYGGFECEGWSYDIARRAQVRSPENIALRIASSQRGVYLENLSFRAADARDSPPATSSFGAFITDSDKISLQRVELIAGSGLAGARGDAGTVGMDATLPSEAQQGQSTCTATAPKLAAWSAAVCGSKGGAGGLNLPPYDGEAGTPSTHVTPSGVNNGGKGAMGVGGPNTATPGLVGSPGDEGPAAASAAPIGTFAATGYLPADGNVGQEGHPGQGGGGGGASLNDGCSFRAGGGAGGLGGCGGGPGTGGRGGGASVGLLSWSSEVSLLHCRVTSSSGGPGGAGGDAAEGGQGGPGGRGTVVSGTPPFYEASAPGGPGGRGGPGGSGSGGSGGPSYALVHFGNRPVSGSDSLLKFGSGGAAGPGGQLLEKAPDGSVGESGFELEIPK